MKRNLLTGLILLLGVPAAALAANATHAKKHAVVAQAGSSSAKSDAGAAAKSTKKKGKAAKPKASKNGANKATQVK